MKSKCKLYMGDNGTPSIVTGWMRKRNKKVGRWTFVVQEVG